MTIHYYGGLKAVTWLFGLAAVAAFAIEPTVKVAIIVAIPSAITGIGTLVLGFLNRKDAKEIHAVVTKVETQTNNMNTELRQQRNAATTRADSAEGQMKGVAAEQERTKDKP